LKAHNVQVTIRHWSLSKENRMRRKLRSRVQAGFTLLELMIVVSILGILAATAMPAFQSYIMRTRANDGRMLVEIIKLRQESYRSEFGTYVTAGANPAATPGSQPVAWPTGIAGWTELGFVPPGVQTRFSVETTAFAPGTAAFGMTGNDFSYEASAIGNLNDDGVKLTFQGYSEADFIWCSSERGYD